MAREDPLVAATLQVVRELHEIHEQLKTNNNYNAILVRLAEMENKMAIKLSEIKAVVAAASKANSEAFKELGTKIADLQKQIEDLISGNGDPEVTDEAFEEDLRQLAEDAKLLADIVPGTPTPPTPEE